MSLATRCTACGTIFRVVQDQLRVSDGWVRCGRCAEVFDARLQLFDIDRETPPPWQAPEAQPEPQQAAATPPAEQGFEPPPPEPEPACEPPSAPEPAPEPFGLAADGSSSNSPDSTARREPYWPDPEAESELIAQVSGIAAASSSAASAAPPSDIQAAQLRLAPNPVSADDEEMPMAAAAAESAPQASFLRQGSRGSKRNGRWLTLALSLAALLLTGTLLWQLTWQFRNALQAIHPPAAPLLQSFCAVSGCSLAPWKRIEVLAVESSGLTQAAAGNHYKLSMLLRNKAAYTVAMPWVDLSLTDANGAPVARRMLRPAELSPTKATIAAQAEESLQLVFSTGNRKVSGYQVVIFHP